MGSCRSNRAYDRLGNGLRVAMHLFAGSSFLLPGLPWQVAVYPSEAPGIFTVVLPVLFCPRRVEFGTLILRPLASFARLGSVFSTLSGTTFGSALSVRIKIEISRRLTTVDECLLGSATNVVSFTRFLGSSLLVASGLSCGYRFSVLGNLLVGSVLSAVAAIHLGSSFSLRSFGRRIRVSIWIPEWTNLSVLQICSVGASFTVTRESALSSAFRLFSQFRSSG
jgi:hypothetical protein